MIIWYFKDMQLVLLAYNIVVIKECSEGGGRILWYV